MSALPGKGVKSFLVSNVPAGDITLSRRQLPEGYSLSGPALDSENLLEGASSPYSVVDSYAVVTRKLLDSVCT
jgi:hypothetical protein